MNHMSIMNKRDKYVIRREFIGEYNDFEVGRDRKSHSSTTKYIESTNNTIYL